ncbi:MAG: hypothetical protein EZS28_043824, partial [Streblomastix strix]
MLVNEINSSLSIAQSDNIAKLFANTAASAQAGTDESNDSNERDKLKERDGDNGNSDISVQNLNLVERDAQELNDINTKLNQYQRLKPANAYQLKKALTNQKLWEQLFIEIVQILPQIEEHEHNLQEMDEYEEEILEQKDERFNDNENENKEDKKNDENEDIDNDSQQKKESIKVEYDSLRQQLRQQKNNIINKKQKHIKAIAEGIDRTQGIVMQYIDFVNQAIINRVDMDVKEEEDEEEEEEEMKEEEDIKEEDDAKEEEE